MDRRHVLESRNADVHTQAREIHTRPERFIPARVDGTVVRDAKVGTALLLALFVSIGAAIAQWAGLL